MSETIHFSCTMCGKCCHNLRLPLSVDEAINWLRDGGEVQFFCDAIPWPDEPAEHNLLARHKRQRSFAAECGALPVRVAVTLVASFEGRCPFLQDDMRCGAYTKRPRVCRIYPAEVNPFVSLDPSSKACPPEAWGEDKPVLTRNKVIVDMETAALVAQSREVDAQDAGTKARVCMSLGISTAALANEGFAIHAPNRDFALKALSAARLLDHNGFFDQMQWSFVTNRSSTRSVLEEIGADVMSADDAALTKVGYFPFQAPD